MEESNNEKESVLAGIVPVQNLEQSKDSLCLVWWVSPSSFPPTQLPSPVFQRDAHAARLNVWKTWTRVFLLQLFPVFLWRPLGHQRISCIKIKTSQVTGDGFSFNLRLQGSAKLDCAEFGAQMGLVSATPSNFCIRSNNTHQLSWSNSLSHQYQLLFCLKCKVILFHCTNIYYRISRSWLPDFDRADGHSFDW